MSFISHGFINQYLSTLGTLIASTKAPKGTEKAGSSVHDLEVFYDSALDIRNINEIMERSDTMKSLLEIILVSVNPLDDKNTNLWERIVGSREGENNSKKKELFKKGNSGPVPKLIHQCKSSSLTSARTGLFNGANTIRYSLKMEQRNWLIVPKEGANILVEYIAKDEYNSARNIYVDGEYRDKYVDFTEDIIDIVDQVEVKLIRQYGKASDPETVSAFKKFTEEIFEDLSISGFGEDQNMSSILSVGNPLRNKNKK